MTEAAVERAMVDAVRLLGEQGRRAVQLALGVSVVERRATITSTLERLCPAWKPAGAWKIFVLSSGGFFMAPPVAVTISIPAMKIEEVLPAEAAGVVVCLYAFEQMAEQGLGDRFTTLHARLLEYAETHENRSAILKCYLVTPGQAR